MGNLMQLKFSVIVGTGVPMNHLTMVKTHKNKEVTGMDNMFVNC